MKYRLLILFILICSIAYSQKALTLNDALQLALKNNYDILIAQNDASISKVNNTAGNAGMLPKVALTGSGSLEQISETQKLSTGTVNNYPSLSSTGLTAGAELSWTLFDGGKMFVTKSKLNEIQSLGEILFKERVLQTMFDVTAGYYDVVRQKQQLTSIKEALNYNNERLIIAVAGYKAGSLLKSEVLQTKIDLNVQTENLINQEYAIVVALKNLNQLLGKNSNELYEISDSIPLDYTPDKSALVQKINSANTSILAYQKQINIAQLSLKENRTAYFPTLSLKGGYYVSQTVSSAGTVLQNNTAGPQVGGSLVIPIYSAGENKRKVSAAKLQAESAQYDLENVKIQVNTELQNTLTEFENQLKLLNIERENNELAKENIQISLDRLKQGQTTSLEVHLAQEDYVQSSTRLINFRYNLKIAEVKLKQMVSAL